MIRDYTKRVVERKIVLDGLKAVGDAAGVKASKPKIKKEMEGGISIVNQLLEMLFTKRGNNNKREIELTSLGLIVAYNLYRGIKKGKKSSLIKGVFLGTTLAAALVAHIKLSHIRLRGKRNSLATNKLKAVAN